MNTHKAAELVDLGKYIPALLNPQLNDDLGYSKSLDELVELAERFDFRGACSVAKPLQRSMERLRDLQSYNAHILHLRTTAINIEHALGSDSLETNVIVSNVEPPPQLLALSCRENYQEALRDDVATCLRAELNRPAIVTAWALGYDLIRCWIFDDQARLDALNAQLKLPKPIDKYEDFFDVGERRVLRACCDSKHAALNDFTDKTFRKLEGLLDERNNFAHANFDDASPQAAATYVEKIIRVVNGPPFNSYRLLDSSLCRECRPVMGVCCEGH
jgi:hypothetical protein